MASEVEYKRLIYPNEKICMTVSYCSRGCLNVSKVVTRVQRIFSLKNVELMRSYNFYLKYF